MLSLRPKTSWITTTARPGDEVLGATKHASRGGRPSLEILTSRASAALLEVTMASLLDALCHKFFGGEPAHVAAELDLVVRRHRSRIGNLDHHVHDAQRLDEADFVAVDLSVLQ